MKGKSEKPATYSIYGSFLNKFCLLHEPTCDRINIHKIDFINQVFECEGEKVIPFNMVQELRSTGLIKGY